MNGNRWIRQTHRWLSIAFYGDRHRQLHRPGAGREDASALGDLLAAAPDLRLAEDGQQPRVGVDRALVDGILEAIRLDVVPELLDHFGASQGLAPMTAASSALGVIALPVDFRAALGAPSFAGLLDPR